MIPDADSIANAPPTQPAPLRSVPPSWPDVIGIIAIVFGALGAIGGVWGLISPLFMKMLASILPKAQSAMMHKVWTDLWPVMILHGLATLTLGIMLLAAGVGLRRRRPWSLPLTRRWAYAKLVVVVLGSILGIIMQREQMAAQSGPALPPRVMQAMVVAGAAVGLAWGAALPVFMLVWLARDRIRRHTAKWAYVGQSER